MSITPPLYDHWPSLMMVDDHSSSTLHHYLPPFTSSHPDPSNLASSHLFSSHSYLFSPLLASFYPILTFSRLFSPLLATARLFSPLHAYSPVSHLISTLFAPFHLIPPLPPTLVSSRHFLPLLATFCLFSPLLTSPHSSNLFSPLTPLAFRHF